eukprot:TRINITY_DN16556_c0_g1_i1.p1 TRINITY_DN16556_c0_g1~~TRINITY_DN16556_c0_g1_i1.p1  ORF type:complete len:213 (+),score=69.81 TRINITY_DN16556_c0_g1_i1:82-639(+)
MALRQLGAAAGAGRCRAAPGGQLRCHSTPKSFYRHGASRTGGNNVKYKFYPTSMSGPPEVRGLRLNAEGLLDPGQTASETTAQALAGDPTEDGWERDPWRNYANAVGMIAVASIGAVFAIYWGRRQRKRRLLVQEELDTQRQHSALAEAQIDRLRAERDKACAELAELKELLAQREGALRVLQQR